MKRVRGHEIDFDPRPDLESLYLLFVRVIKLLVAFVELRTGACGRIRNDRYRDFMQRSRSRVAQIDRIRRRIMPVNGEQR